MSDMHEHYDHDGITVHDHPHDTSDHPHSGMGDLTVAVADEEETEERRGSDV